MNKISKRIHLTLQVLLTLVLVVVIILAVSNGLESKLFGFTYSILLPFIVVILLVLEFSWLLLDYYKHRKPLLAVDPEVEYSLIHHIRQVTIPIIKYRFNNMFKK